MFNGIVFNQGLVKKIAKRKKGINLFLKSDLKVKKKNIGISISCDGVCLTLINIKNKLMEFYLSNETIKRSKFKKIKIGDYINIETPLKFGKQISGHIIQGHIETLGVILDKQTEKDNIVLSVGLDPEWMRFCIPKGSIALDGISLTISRIEANIIEVSLIPHTLKNTTLGMKNKSDTLNVETDIIGKYVDRLLSFDNEESEIDLGILKTIRHIQYGES